MDPDVTLARLRELHNKQELGEPYDPEEFAEQFANLDGWLSHGGFLPYDWAFPRFPADRQENK